MKGAENPGPECRMKKGAGWHPQPMIKLWTEDDVTTHDPDHVTLEKAWYRLFRETTAESRTETKQVEFADFGDAEFTLYEDGRVMVRSYPGRTRSGWSRRWLTSGSCTTTTWDKRRYAGVQRRSPG